jgi:hypothetical protein
VRIAQERRSQRSKKDTLKRVTPIRTQDIIVNWKKALRELNTKNEEKIIFERNWAGLCKRLRDLCPETNWLFIDYQMSSVSQEYLKAIHVWLEGLIAAPAWPFPETVLLISEYQNNQSSWKMLFQKPIQKIPFTTPPNSLKILPYHDEYSSGWQIMAIDSFITNQSGEA